MARDYCGETINEFPWTCKRCGQTFCKDNRFPESSDYQGIGSKNFFEPLTLWWNLLNYGIMKLL